MAALWGEPGPPLCFVSARVMMAARFVADSDTVPVVTTHWLYAGAKQATRGMVRVGPAA